MTEQEVRLHRLALVEDELRVIRDAARNVSNQAHAALIKLRGVELAL